MGLMKGWVGTETKYPTCYVRRTQMSCQSWGTLPSGYNSHMLFSVPLGTQGAPCLLP